MELFGKGTWVLTVLSWKINFPSFTLKLPRAGVPRWGCALEVEAIGSAEVVAALLMPWGRTLKESHQMLALKFLATFGNLL